MIKVHGYESICGEVALDGAKNAALPLIAISCLTEGKVILRNVPMKLNDINVFIRVLRQIGFKIDAGDQGELTFTPCLGTNLNGNVSEEASLIRSTLILMPLLIHEIGYAVIPMPGGCKLGDRKYDILLELLRRMGVTVEETSTHIICRSERRMRGCDITFHTASTIGSECALLAGVLAEGTTIVRNANTRPEIIEMIHFLNLLGARIKYSTRYIEIEGVERLVGGEYSVIKDEHEAVSYMIFAAMTRGEVCFPNFSTDTIKEDITLLNNIGVDVFSWGDGVYCSAKNKQLRPFDLTTAPYPGINSDMQPLFAALAATIPGESIITDTRFTERFQYVDEFVKLGVNIVNYQNCAIIQGGKKLNGSSLWATDLRAGAALTFLAIAANEVSTIDNYYQTLRGYTDIVKKLGLLGAKLEVIPDEKP